MAKPINVSKYFTMLKPFQILAEPGYYKLSSAVLRSQLELAYMEGVLSEGGRGATLDANAAVDAARQKISGDERSSRTYPGTP